MSAYDHLRVEIGLSNGWIIRSEGGAVLVDAGFDRFAPRVAWGLRYMGLRPRDLKLVIITHAHIDHIGALADIVRGTGAAVAVSGHGAAHATTATNQSILMCRSCSPGGTAWRRSP